MLSNAIFSTDRNSSYADHSLHDEMENVLKELNNCLASTKRVAEKSPNQDYQNGVDCLTATSSEIEKISLGMMSRQTVTCR